MSKEDLSRAKQLLQVDEREVTAAVADAKYQQATGLILLDIAETLRVLLKFERST